MHAAVDKNRPESEPAKRSASRLREWLRSAGWLVVIGGGFLIARLYAGTANIPAGSMSPALAFTLGDGERFDLAEARAGVVVLNFWATWCAACKRQLPELARVAAEGHARVIGVCIDESEPSPLQPIARRLGVEFPTGYGGPAAARRFRVETIPTTYVIDRHGKIIRGFVGSTSVERLRGAIASAAATP
jgi:thiol-disulfide isomerase/thioredoxin